MKTTGLQFLAALIVFSSSLSVWALPEKEQTHIDFRNRIYNTDKEQQKLANSVRHLLENEKEQNPQSSSVIDFIEVEVGWKGSEGVANNKQKKEKSSDKDLSRDPSDVL